MAEKTVSKHLINLEKHFALTQPVLQKAGKVFHELDQIEYDLGLIQMDETSARKNSWWPIVSIIGGNSLAKNNFLSRYLGTTLQSPVVHTSTHKFTVLQHTPQTTQVTLPGTALDVDYRLPFYQISERIELKIKGEGSKINGYLELKTLHSEKLKGKLFIDTPLYTSTYHSPAQMLLTEHVLDISDLIFVFTDLFEADEPVSDELIKSIISHQDSNKFVYIIDRSDMSLDAVKTNEAINAWQKKLAQMGLDTGEFIVLSEAGENQDFNGMAAIEQRLANVENDRSYRVLHGLETSIRGIDDVIMPLVQDALVQWKERANMTTLIIAGFIISLVLFAEISMGVLDLLLDPLTGSLSLLAVIGVLVPTHLLNSRIHAKFIMKQLNKQQKELNLTESLAGLFEKSLTFWRILLPITEPVGSNRKMRAKLAQLIEKNKELIQSLNDGFSYEETEESAFYSKL
jgi:ssDNA-specific exonuclease RecJ